MLSITYWPINTIPRYDRRNGTNYLQVNALKCLEAILPFTFRYRLKLKEFLILISFQTDSNTDNYESILQQASTFTTTKKLCTHRE